MSDEIDKGLRRARRAAEAGDTARAANIVRTLLYNEPDSVAGLLALAGWTSDIVERSSLIERVLRLDPQNAEALRLRAESPPATTPTGNKPLGDDPFGTIFEAFFGGQQSKPKNAPKRGDDLRYNLQISLREAALGAEKEIQYRRLDTCPNCSGSGGEPGIDPVRCGKCLGTGEVRQRAPLFNMVTVTACDLCDGKGFTFPVPCRECQGEGRVRRTQTVAVKVPAGVDDNKQIRIVGLGDVGQEGGTPGNLYVALKIPPDAELRREGSDLHYTLTIDVFDAVLGGEFDIPSLEGRERLRLSPGVADGQVLRLRGKGVPLLRQGGRGDLLVTVDVADGFGRWSTLDSSAERLSLIGELGERRSPRALELLIRLLAENAPVQGLRQYVPGARRRERAEARAAIAAALGQYGAEGDEVRRELRTLLADPEPQVRRAAVDALAPHVQRPDVAAWLRSAARDDSQIAVRLAASGALAAVEAAAPATPSGPTPGPAEAAHTPEPGASGPEPAAPEAQPPRAAPQPPSLASLGLERRFDNVVQAALQYADRLRSALRLPAVAPEHLFAGLYVTSSPSHGPTRRLCDLFGQAVIRVTSANQQRLDISQLVISSQPDGLSAAAAPLDSSAAAHLLQTAARADALGKVEPLDERWLLWALTRPPERGDPDSLLADLLGAAAEDPGQWLADWLQVERASLHQLLDPRLPDIPYERIRAASRRARPAAPRYRAVLRHQPERPAVGQRVTVEVSLEPAAGGEGFALAPDVAAVPCFLEGEGLHLVGAAALSILVAGPARPPRPARFELLAHSAGQLSYTARLYVEEPGRGAARVVQEQSRIRVVAPPPGQASTTPAEPLAVPITTRPDMQITVGAERAGGRLRLRYWLSCRLPGLVTSDEPAGEAWLGEHELARLRAALHQTLGACRGAPPAESRAALLAFGAQLYGRLLPADSAPRLRTALAQAAPRLSSLLLVEDGAAPLPWELLAIPGPDGGPASMLGERYQLARWAAGLGAPLYDAVPLGELALIDGDPAARQAGGPLAAWGRLLEAPVGAASIAQLPQLRQTVYGLHLRYRPGAGPREIAPREAGAAAADEMADARAELWRRRPVVGLSAHTAGAGAGWQLAEQVGPLLRSGASAVVGPWWPTDAESDAIFYRSFYELLRARIPLGEAVLGARQALRLARPDSPDALAYSLYGHPLARAYLPEAGQGYAAIECLSADAPLRPGASYGFQISVSDRPPLWYTERLVQAGPPAEGAIVAQIFTQGFAAPEQPVPLRRAGWALAQAVVELRAPDRPGSYALFVLLTRDGEPLRDLQLTVQVGPDEPAEIAAPASDRPGAPAEIAAAAPLARPAGRDAPRELLVTFEGEKIWLGNVRHLRGDRGTADSHASSELLVRALDRLREAVQRHGPSLPRDEMEQYLSQLRQAGRVALNKQFPEAARRELRAIEAEAGSRGLRLTFLAQSDDRSLWELFYDGPPDGPVDPRGFWGMRHSIGRVYFDVRSVDRVRLRGGVLTAAHESLAFAAEEQGRLGEQIGALGRAAGLRRLDDLLPGGQGGGPGLLRLLVREAERYGVLHLACHCEQPRDGPAERIRLLLSAAGEQLELSLEELKAWEDDLRFAGAPLIFLNACASAAGGRLQQLTFPSQLAKMGAGGVIATACAIPDDVASAFAGAFYQRLLGAADGGPVDIGEQLRATRMEFALEYNNPLGLAYGLYAPAGQQLAWDE